METKSICELPKWSHAGNFDSFYKGIFQSRLNDTLDSHFFDDYMERVRYFAEASSRMSVIEMYTDFHNGFAGLSYSILDKIREEYGNSLAVACFCFPDPYPTTSRSHGLTTRDVLRDLNLPLAYSSISELANIIIPMDMSETLSHINVISSMKNRIEVSAAVASVVESATGTYISEPFTSEELIFLATKGGNFPICSIEAYISSLDNRTAHNIFDARIKASFNDLGCDDVVRPSATATSRSSTLNPFCGSMSSVSSGKWRASTILSAHSNNCMKPFTNVVNFRGTLSSGELLPLCVAVLHPLHTLNNCLYCRCE